MDQRSQRSANRNREPEHRRCAPLVAPKRDSRMARTQGAENTFRGSLPFSEIRCADRYVTACLTVTFRSQGFAPSQRFGPRTSLRLCFTPLPLVGFSTFRAFSARISRDASRHPLLSCHWTHTLTHGLKVCEHTLSIVKGAHILTSEPCSDLASDTPHDRLCRTKPLLSWPSCL